MAGFLYEELTGSLGVARGSCEPTISGIPQFLVYNDSHSPDRFSLIPTIQTRMKRTRLLLCSVSRG